MKWAFNWTKQGDILTSGTELLKGASKIVPKPEYSENINDKYNSSLWMFNLIQKQDDEL